MTLRDATQIADDGTWHVPSSWEQGRGAYGGLVFGALMRAMEQRTQHPPRVLQGFLPNVTAPGEARIETAIERQGATTATISAHVLQNGSKTGIAMLLAGDDRPDPPKWQLSTRPEAPPWQEIPELKSQPFVPTFIQHMSARPLQPYPFSRAAAAHVRGWISLRESCDVSPAVYVTALIDAYWPAAMAVFGAPRAMTTVAFTLEFCALHEIELGEPMLLSGTAPIAVGGYVYETRELWTGDGALVARNHQTYAALR